MSDTCNNQSIILKEYLTGKDYEEIKELMELCLDHDHINLKLELDYKLTVTRHSETRMKDINEFLYYLDGRLVSYLGICDFGGNVLELNGMTHPDYRRRGYFRKLLALAVQEAKNKGHESLLLLSDENSGSGVQFIEQAEGKYTKSEYRMKLFENRETGNATAYNDTGIGLKAADKTDLKDIARQNAIYFNTTEESETSLIDEAVLKDGMYMIKLKGETIGKINVEYDGNSAFIFGFGILPEFRGKGCGKAAFQAVLKIIKEKNIDDIQLDVETKNRNALNLYKSFGFEEMSVMNYYEYII